MLVAAGLLSLAVQSRSPAISHVATHAAGCLMGLLPPAVAALGWPTLYFGAFTAVVLMPLVLVACIGWAWVQSERDRYVGYVPSAALTAEIMPATHRVKALGTFVYPSADMKTPPVMHLPLNADVRVAEWSERFGGAEG